MAAPQRRLYDSPMTLAVAIAALVLSVISLAFTGYQWIRSGSAVVVRFLLWHPWENQDDKWPDYRNTVFVMKTFANEPGVLKVEVLSVGRLPVIVRKVTLTLEADEVQTLGSWNEEDNRVLEPAKLSHELPVTLDPTAVLEAEFHFALHQEPTSFVATARAQTGSRWVKSRPQKLVSNIYKR